MKKKIVRDIAAAVAFARRVGFPVKLEASFTLQWNETEHIANTESELIRIFREGATLSPTGEICLIQHRAG